MGGGKASNSGGKASKSGGQRLRPLFYGASNNLLRKKVGRAAMATPAPVGVGHVE